MKQRLIGAAVLVALAVIFLPMLIKGPAPESGLSDVPLDLPAAPQGQYETRELPLLAPANAAGGASVVGLERDAAPPAPASDEMMPAATAGGNYAVSFGSYASAADAERVVGALRASQLPGYQQASSGNGRTVYRVRIGPYASQATAEAARLRAAHVRDDVGAQVVVLDAEAASTASAAAPATDAPVETEPAKPAAAAPSPSATTTRPAADTAPSAPAKPVATKPLATPAPAAADVGFAVQIAAFSNDADAQKLRDRARALGFSAFVERVRTERGMLSRVRLGPVLDRAAAETLKAQAASKLGIDGLIQSHP